MVEHDLAKVGVASSNLVSRSIFLSAYSVFILECMPIFLSFVIVRRFLASKNKQVTWLGGRVVMQRTATPCTPVRFRPQPPLKFSKSTLSSPGGEIGRRKGLKIPRLL